jgi:hypothetical protein
LTLSITGAAATSAILLSQSSLTFSGTAGGANPAPKTFSIAHTGGGTLAGTANDTAAWLASITPKNGPPPPRTPKKSDLKLCVRRHASITIYLLGLFLHRGVGIRMWRLSQAQVLPSPSPPSPPIP